MDADENAPRVTVRDHHTVAEAEIAIVTTGQHHLHPRLGQFARDPLRRIEIEPLFQRPSRYRPAISAAVPRIEDHHTSA